MLQQTIPDPSVAAPEPFWYREPNAVRHWFYGVFEGGGAKGVAFVGALQAMRERQCWFRGVAGASAGAITAALIASGATPEDVEHATAAALQRLKTGRWRGFRSLRAGKGYFPSAPLAEWLEAELRTRIPATTAEDPPPKVTFQEMFAATGIELNVVAADISLQCQVVFSHHQTPSCSVTDAVIASSSIPFAFASRLLCDNEEGEAAIHHTVVDGGVWANFPLFVFEDPHYREEYGQSPIDSREVIGFLLHEGDAPNPPRGEHVRFVSAVKGAEFHAREWGDKPPQRPFHPDDSVTYRLASSFTIFRRSGLGRILIGAPLWLLKKIADIAGRNGPSERGRWPQASSPFGSTLVRVVDGLFGGMHAIVPALIGLFAVGIGSWTVIRFFALDMLHSIPTTDWSDPFSILARPLVLLLGVVLICTAALLPVVMLLGLLANAALLIPARRTLFSLIRTYVAGSGAPGWIARRKRNVIPLPIPSQVGTLSFELDAQVKADLLASARQTTLAKLEHLISDRERVPPRT